jgi:hypothetical protein
MATAEGTISGDDHGFIEHLAHFSRTSPSFGAALGVFCTQKPASSLPKENSLVCFQQVPGFARTVLAFFTFSTIFAPGAGPISSHPPALGAKSSHVTTLVA